MAIGIQTEDEIGGIRWGDAMEIASNNARPRATRHSASSKAYGVAVLSTLLLAGFIYAGSWGLKYFDPALTPYALVSLLAVSAVVFRLTLWLDRPPTRVVFARALTNLRRLNKDRWGGSGAGPGDKNDSIAKADRLRVADAAGTVISTYGTQRFIRKRATFRWMTHLCLSWGSMLAFAVAFPLVFGWVHFETPAQTPEVYRVVALGVSLGAFSIHSVPAMLAFNALNIAGVLVLFGVVMAAVRRLRDPTERATQRFVEDWVPLIVLFFVAVTGLSLTFSTHVISGKGFSAFATAHLISVAVLLLYIPYGKLFHMFQRTAHLAVQYNRRAAKARGNARCRSCGDAYATMEQIEDLKRTLALLGTRFIYRKSTGGFHYQEVCPRCRRALLAVNQAHTLGGALWLR